MHLTTYLEYAEMDYRLFVGCYDAGFVTNPMGSLAQNGCEKYMKHLISELYTPETKFDKKLTRDVLREHELGIIQDFLKEKLGFEFSADAQYDMGYIDGFYMSARYPGITGDLLDEEDMAHCLSAITKCREESLAFLEQSKTIVDNIIKDAAARACDRPDAHGISVDAPEL